MSKIHNYTISFMSLRGGVVYTVNIGGATGTTIALKGAAQPFVTTEDDSDDIFTSIRTQSGYVRIIDDGLADDGVTTFDWTDLLPADDLDRPVTLTAGGVILWQGYVQAQNFGHRLFGNPQEFELPVMCPLSALQGIQPSTSDVQPRNFAHIIYLCCSTLNGRGSSIQTLKVQGGNDAIGWLQKRVDWQNFFQQDDANDLTPRYDLQKMLSDVCRFWGWTVRLQGSTLYLLCMDDSEERTIATLSMQQLASLASGDAPTVTPVNPHAATMTGSVLASVNSDSVVRRGVSKATVSVDINQQDSMIKAFPASVQKTLDDTGYTWVAGSEARVGYFTTAEILSFTSPLLDGSAVSGAGAFARRQVFSSADDTQAEKMDCIILKNTTAPSDAVATIRSKKAMTFGGGSLEISANIYTGDHLFAWGQERGLLHFNIGIGMTLATAKWFYIQYNYETSEYEWSWDSVQGTTAAVINGGRLESSTSYYKLMVLPAASAVGFRTIPLPVPDGVVTECLSGYVFVEFLGATRGIYAPTAETEFIPVEVGNFEITYSRNDSDIVTSVERERVMEIERVSTAEYTHVNDDTAGEEWNADCIFGTDNNMEYGYGLLMNEDGTFMTSASYGGTDERPEQRLADRVATFWNRSRQVLTIEALSTAAVSIDGSAATVADITPDSLTTFGGTTFHPVAVSRDWRDDVSTVTMIEI